jgi:ABC-type Fe3+/spermidine/putrescine transport system ATPase subunit
MCKKGEAAGSKLENAANAADSAVSVASEKINDVNDKANAALDSANVKIKEFEKTGNDVKDKIANTSKIVDSLSEKISSVKLETKKDSAKKEEKIVVNVPAPKVIKETKIVYKDKPKKENYELNVPKNKLVKTGILELTVDDAETAKEIVKQEVSKYDGFIRSENISLNNDEKKIAYLKVRVPIQKFDYLMEDLSYNLGKVENKSIELSGQDIVQNTMCEVDITLYGKADGYSENNEPKTFGDKSFAAISSGWEVITSILLFILPLWPLFLILGVGYYFYKRRGKNTTNNDSN